jgi:hypothetical protein
MIIDLSKQDKTPVEQSGYYRLTGCSHLAYLARRMHATVISNGSELERMICADAVRNGTFVSVGNRCEDFINHLNSEDNHLIYFDKLNVSRSALEDAGIPLASKNKITVDGVWILPNKSVLVCEYKDGDGFDTKKSDAEIKSLQKILKWMSFVGATDAQAVMVLWNCYDLSNSSVKSKEAGEYLATAADFIGLLPPGSLDEARINQKRYKDREQNLKAIVEYIQENILEKT